MVTPGIPPHRFQLPLSIGVLVAFGWLLFFRLGHYPLWCDEADTALYARGVARTGDTSAVLDQNIYAFRNGACLVDLRQRYEPPAPFYLAAPFVGREGTGAFWPRFPFAVCGLLTIALIFLWLWRDGASPLLWTLMALGLTLNVSLVLYFRQCRYYALAALVSVAAAYCYLHWDGRRRWLIGFSLLAIFLLLTHYLAYAGLMAGVAIDYALFARRERRLRLSDWALVLIPQLVAVAVVVPIWNPLNKDVVAQVPDGNWWIKDRLTIMWWNLRDLSACEFGVGLLLLIAPALYWVDKNRWLLRGTVAIASYTLVVAVFSPQPVARTFVADVRYLSALIPLCVFLGSLVILTLSRGKWWIAVPLALVAFGTNVLNQPWNPAKWQSTSWQWIAELRTARTTPTQRAIHWVNDHVRPGQSIWVQPEFMRYALMYHAPQAVYAWQLQSPPQGQFKNLASIHFFGDAWPDFILAFGRRELVDQVIAGFQNQLPIGYLPADTLDIYWDELTRPELFGRRFQPVTEFNTAHQAVYTWRRQDVAEKTP